jgi:GntR family transcriptional regulator
MINLRKKMPLYIQIETALKSQIRMGELQEGDRLPSEKKLSEQFGVSPLTVRQALSALVEEGYLDRKPGRGTIIKKEYERRVVLNLTGDINELLSVSKETETKVIHYEILKYHRKATSALRLKADDPICFVSKQRYWRNIPFMVVEEFLPKSKLGTIPGGKGLGESFYSILTQRKGYALEEAIQTIESSTADQRIASSLRIEIGSPIFYMERTFFEKVGLPILYQITSTRADQFKFVVHLERLHKEKEIKWAAY